MLDEEFFSSLPSDDVEAILTIVSNFEKSRTENTDLDSYIQIYTSIKQLAQNIDIKFVDVSFVGSDDDNRNRINGFIKRIFDQAKMINISRKLGVEEQKFKSIRNNVYEYEFKDDDYEEIQRLINKMRELLQQSQVISDNHRYRLLNRLEVLQKELHKKVSNLDRALGFLLDVSIIVQQTGEGVKPIADLAKEISKILTQVIFVSQGIPPGELPTLLK
jgi:multidrug efflux pump subunit AcrB